MTMVEKIADIRRDYGGLSLNEESIHTDPLKQFQVWFDDIIAMEKTDPTAMVLSTVDEQGFPDSRVVLLKSLDNGHFVFFTNYQSAKAKQIESNPVVALNFFWPEMARQVRIRGIATRVSEAESDDYFASRPLKSQLSAIISPQSQIIASRAVLEEALSKLSEQQSQPPIPRPSFWGGYKVKPDLIEFWQGRDNRLHDRICYHRHADNWLIQRLAP